MLLLGRNMEMILYPPSGVAGDGTEMCKGFREAKEGPPMLSSLLLTQY